MPTQRKLAPVHPGEILREEFMQPLGLSQTRLGRDLGVSPRRINEIVHGKRSITADTALRLSRYFGTSAEFWVRLQADYDLDLATGRLSDRIDREVKVFAPGLSLKKYQAHEDNGVYRSILLSGRRLPRPGLLERAR
jgi:antitoxin HigA-1